MTIDEAVEKFKFIANSENPCPRYCMLPCDKCVDESKQLAEWLEELKYMRNLDKTNFSDGYNRALDDFLKEADATFPMHSDGTAVLRRLEKIADRLKGGGYCE